MHSIQIEQITSRSGSRILEHVLECCLIADRYFGTGVWCSFDGDNGGCRVQDDHQKEGVVGIDV